MKKFFVMMFSAAAVAMIASGCTTVFTSDGARQVPQPNTIDNGYEAQFSHKDVRVKGQAKVHVLFGLFAWGANGFAENSDLTTFSFLPSPANFAKSAAVYNTCLKNSADTLVGTRYKLTIKDYFLYKNVSCEVAGFPATMNGVKKLEAYVLRGKETDSIVYLSKMPKIVK